MNKQEIEQFIFGLLKARTKILLEMEMSSEKRIRFSELEQIELDFLKALKKIS